MHTVMLVVAVVAVCCSAADATDVDAHTAKIEAQATEIKGFEAKIEALEAKIKTQAAEIKTQAAENKALKAKIKAQAAEIKDSLYQINMSTSWVKLVPGRHFQKYAPGAIELEFYTPSTASVKPTCRWNPSLLSTDARCSDAWNNYVITNHRVKGKKNELQLEYVGFNPSNAKAYRQLLANKRVSVGATAINTNQKSIMAFKLSRPTVGGTKFGDCRSFVQGPNCKRRGHDTWVTCRTCVVAKWTSCSGNKCKVKKNCFVVGLDSLPARHSTRVNTRLAACMSRRCEQQCIMG